MSGKIFIEIHPYKHVRPVVTKVLETLYHEYILGNGRLQKGKTFSGKLIVIAVNGKFMSILVQCTFLKLFKAGKWKNIV